MTTVEMRYIVYRFKHHHPHDFHERNNNFYTHRQPQKTLLKISLLHYAVTREHLQQICEKYGRVKACRIHWDIMGRSKETASVEYFHEADAQRAATALKGYKIENQQIAVELAIPTFLPAKRHDIQKGYNGKYRHYNRFPRRS